MFDLISDILSSLGKNKLRTFLTGFSMAWGIFMLVVLLGCGNGLKNAMIYNYSDRKSNIMTIWPGRTSMPYNGLQSGRRTCINDKVLDQLHKDFPEIGLICPIRSVWSVKKTHGAEYVNGGLYGITAERFSLEKVTVTAGRTINSMDIAQKRKVVMMHQTNVETLFKGAAALGEYVVFNNVPYKIIGIYKDNGNNQTPPDFIPLSTMEMIYPSANGYNSITLEIIGINSVEQSVELERRIRRTISGVMDFNPEDKSAVWMWNSMSDYMQTMNIFNGITVFLWLIGIGTLIAGVVGISNIMLVTVKERTKEFGIRKSLGAKPSGIISLILSESLLITSAFGYSGLLAGILVLEGISKIFPAPDANAVEMEPTVFMNPEINLWIGIGAMAILIVAGLAAAYVPAKKAVLVKPIEALHYE